MSRLSLVLRVFHERFAAVGPAVVDRDGAAIERLPLVLVSSAALVGCSEPLPE